MSSTSEGPAAPSSFDTADGKRPAVLCLDAELAFGAVLSRHLKGLCDVIAVSHVHEAMRAFAERKSVEVVVADMQMPGMDGAAFLQRVRQTVPDAIRVLVSGHTDLADAIPSLNEAQVFRFVAKPWSRVALLAAVEAAVVQHRRVAEERAFHQETPQAGCKILADVLALTNPVAFGRATRIKQHITRMADHLDATERWQVEMAALLSEIGAITLSPDTTEKLGQGQLLTNAEDALVERLPAVAEQLLAHVPRFDVVRAILAGQGRSPWKREPGGPQAPLITWASEILRIAGDFDLLEGQGVASAQALEIMKSRAGQYDVGLLGAFAARQEADQLECPVREVALLAVRVGMRIADDVRMQNGTLLVTRGYEVNDSFVERVRNFAPGSVREPVRVTMIARSEE